MQIPFGEVCDRPAKKLKSDDEKFNRSQVDMHRWKKEFYHVKVRYDNRR